MADNQFKRNIAYKFRVGQILSGKPVMENEKLKFLELEDKQIVRVNLIANIIDKYIQEGEKKFGSLTLDDGTGQIKIKAFGEEVDKLNAFNQGDTVLTIGLLRSWNNEVYITPEILKAKNPSFLLVRKLEAEIEQPKQRNKEEILALKDKILDMIKETEKEGGIDIDKLIMVVKESPDLINKEIKRLLEDGVAYEPRPGKLRWLG